MRSGTLHKAALTAAAVLTLVPLAASATPAQASPGLPAGPAGHTRVDTRYSMTCLFHDNGECQGPHFDASGTAVQVIETFGLAGTVIAGIEKLAANSAITMKVVEILGRSAKKYDPLEETCVGDWGSNGTPLTFGSCQSKHGIYWQQHFTNAKHTSFELFNTYTRQYMVLPGGKPTQNEWIVDDPLKTGEYYTWGSYTPDAGRPRLVRPRIVG